MSNQVCLMSTKFVDRDGTTYGFRMYDNYGTAYNNCSEGLIEDDMQLLRYVKIATTKDRTLAAFFNYIKECESGIEINNTWYDWEEIKDIFDL